VESAENTESIAPAATPQFSYRLLPELVDTGSDVTLAGTLALSQFNRGALQIRLSDGVSYNLNLSNTGTGVLLSGTAHAEALTDCTRCSEEAKISLQAEVESYFIIDQRYHDIAEEDDTAIIVGRDGKVDLVEPIVAGLVLEVPFTVLCKDDCAGLCSRCYANLNIEECTCIEEPDPDHPFAALLALLDDEGNLREAPEEGSTQEMVT